ncbi:glycosyltransferase family 87 protein [Streptomyces catenulae]|uniref:Glycosyltransferase family 87 protein n=1 Tax=Streptomyces catenulae TaxID=66875 RepID=A0ABV2Z1U0_9ACTN|nr:glycosyltransferase family 87 protein [Streptomyces catenulae]
MATDTTHPDGTAAAPTRRGGWRWDWPVLAGCAIAGLSVGLASPPDTSQQAWGLCSAVGYALAAIIAACSVRRWGRWPAIVSVVGAGLVPLIYLTVIDKEQMEVGVIQRGAKLLLDTGTPYNADPHTVPQFNPYLPGMSLFGIPDALFGDNPLTSARLWSLIGFLAVVLWAVRILTKDRGPAPLATPGGVTPSTGALWLIACPVLILPLTIGGVDPPVIGLIVLALAFLQRDRPGAAGLALGVASALKWTAWPAIPVALALLWVTKGKGAAARCAAGSIGLAALAALPAALIDSGAFLQNAILYPLGMGEANSSAQSPLLGHLIVLLLPETGKTVTVALIGVSAVGVAVSLLVRPPRTVIAAADRLAIGLLLAIVLSPATRLGYAIYPVVLIFWPRFAAALSPTDALPPIPRQKSDEPAVAAGDAETPDAAAEATSGAGAETAAKNG